MTTIDPSTIVTILILLVVILLLLDILVSLITHQSIGPLVQALEELIAELQRPIPPTGPTDKR